MLESELPAAAAGGVTSLVCPPDTDPVLDEPGLVEMLKFRARKPQPLPPVPAGRADARPGRRGADRDGRADRGRLRRLLAGRHARCATRWCCSARCSTPPPSATAVWLRPQDAWLGKGVAASGALATRLGLSGVPVAAETIALHTIFELVRDTGARVHLCRLSSAAGVALLRAAKAEGLPVTADVSINSLHLTDVDIGYFNADMRLTPPLRQQRDRDALRAALADGTHRRAGVRPQPGGRRRQDAALRRGRARRDRAGAAAQPGAEVGRGQRRRPGARRWRVSPASRCACSARRSARWRPAPAGWSKAAWPMSACSTRRPPGGCEPGTLKSQGKHTPFASPAPAWRCRAGCAPRWWPAPWPTKPRAA